MLSIVGDLALDDFFEDFRTQKEMENMRYLYTSLVKQHWAQEIVRPGLLLLAGFWEGLISLALDSGLVWDNCINLKLFVTFLAYDVSQSHRDKRLYHFKHVVGICNNNKSQICFIPEHRIKLKASQSNKNTTTLTERIDFS